MVKIWLLCEGATVWAHKLVVNDQIYPNAICTDLSNIRDADCAQQAPTLLFQNRDATDPQIAHHPHRIEHAVARIYRYNLQMEAQGRER
jgi:hypothetical protein